MSLLDVNDLTLTVPTPHGDKQILNGVTFELDESETLALVGESGSGKSMTARSILRLLPRGSTIGGSVTFSGTELTRIEASGMRQIRRDKIGMIFQDPRAHIDPVRTVGDFLIEGLRLRGVGRSDARKAALAGLDAVRIPRASEQLKAFPHELSGGMLQRVMIASVVLAQPAVILADEPTTALDVTSQAEVLAILDELRREYGLAMVLITHDLDLAAAICHRTAVMSAGRIIEHGLSSQIQNAPQEEYTRRLVQDRPSLPPEVVNR